MTQLEEFREKLTSLKSTCLSLSPIAVKVLSGLQFYDVNGIAQSIIDLKDEHTVKIKMIEFSNTVNLDPKSVRKSLLELINAGMIIDNGKHTYTINLARV